MDDWYLVQIKRNSFQLAKRNLDQQGFKTFLPLEDFTSKNGSKFLTCAKPLFPGYMFVTIDVERDPWHKINSTLGVARLICDNSVPKLLPPGIVASLISRCDIFGKLLPPKTLRRGDTVAVLSGALANFIATVEEIESERRIWVLMDMMGQATRVQVASDKLRLLK